MRKLATLTLTVALAACMGDTVAPNMAEAPESLVEATESPVMFAAADETDPTRPDANSLHRFEVPAGPGSIDISLINTLTYWGRFDIKWRWDGRGGGQRVEIQCGSADRQPVPTGYPQAQGKGSRFTRDGWVNARIEMVGSVIYTPAPTPATRNSKVYTDPGTYRSADMGIRHTVRVSWDERPDTGRLTLEWQAWSCRKYNYLGQPYGQYPIEVVTEPDTTTTVNPPPPLDTLYIAPTRSGSIEFSPPSSWTGRGQAQVAGCGTDFHWIQGGGNLNGAVWVECSRSARSVTIRTDGTKVTTPNESSKVTLSWSVRVNLPTPLEVEWQPIAGSSWQPSDGGPIDKRKIMLCRPPDERTKTIPTAGGGTITVVDPTLTC